MRRAATGQGKSSRPRSRRGHGDQLRAEILEAVNRLLDEWGSDEKLTMRAVAEEVGVAAPSIYLHFADKSELVWAALADKYAQLADVMRTAAEATDGGPRDRLLAQVHAYCRFALEHPGHYRLMYQVRQPALDAGKRGHHPSRQVSGRLRRALTECAEAGHHLALPLHQCAHTLWTGLHGIVSIQQTMAPAGGSPDGVYALADGLVDALVSCALGTGEAIPRPTEIDRIIAASVADDD
ncbi:TetR/AcrR family transcriptional regulator [Mycolicibacterium confluentis]|uniref:TetR family transcriptional regulator n=1 Tax=Mycolicibacterium confluentis TaxID=28047 RepID=A0A7I7XTQ3_9MYCO|nr:TetR/AcrR family transcriptional regulator [Mycolicibacterium confluentis]MCV7319402.1 TetR/AcrR family transcriptional regulator [Mycolicibacterium confluentis]ORV24372.1 TetR family transcriptional regulator [Mycolicibacterium confluentis]BBZ32483.1 TetR family transcriptional regulator [Mycolicibacterium confluentis]